MSNLRIQSKIFQEECQKSVENMAKEIPELDINAAQQVWMFTKLAELQIQVNELKFNMKNLNYENNPYKHR